MQRTDTLWGEKRAKRAKKERETGSARGPVEDLGFCCFWGFFFGFGVFFSVLGFFCFVSRAANFGLVVCDGNGGIVNKGGRNVWGEIMGCVG